MHEAEIEQTPEFLSPYFADLHRFFMEKMQALVEREAFPIEEEHRLEDLFAEVIHVKGLLAKREDKW